MKTLRIYQRDILQRTGYKSHPFKEQRQYIIEYGDKIYRNGHLEDAKDKKLRKSFVKMIETRSKNTLWKLLDQLRKTDADKWLVKTCYTIMYHKEEK